MKIVRFIKRGKITGQVKEIIHKPTITVSKVANTETAKFIPDEILKSTYSS